MGHSTLGTWRHPPLAYVVAEVVIAPHYGIGAAIPGIQDKLRSQYPRTLEGTEVTVDANSPPVAQQLWRMLSVDQYRGIQISSRAISLHSTRYLNAAEFLDAWDVVLNVIGTANLDAFVERAGLRYLDLIVPSDERSPREYVTEGVRGIQPPDDGVLQNSIWAGSFFTLGSKVSARIGAPSPTGMLLPPNFSALPLQKPKVWIDAESRSAAGGQIGFIDTDCTREVKQLFQASLISPLFRELKALVSASFRAVMSPLAEGEWV